MCRLHAIGHWPGGESKATYDRIEHDCIAPENPYREFEYLKREASHVVNNWIKLELPIND